MLSLNLDGINWRRAAALGGAGAVLVVIAYVWVQGLNLARERQRTEQLLAAYRNPRIIQKTRTVTVVGPVRIVTRVVELPGRKETTTTEERGAVVNVANAEAVNEPVFPAPAARAGGWLTGVSAQPFHRGERDGRVAWGGYSIGGRLNVCAGISGAPRAELLVLWRW
jgi:hypothetical protein